MEQTRYRGRFAPSPTGPLHFGSLATALASWLEARAASGDWLVRIEDLDPLREPPEAAAKILHSLDCHGLVPDEPVRYQSERHPAYQAAIDQLLAEGSAYYCRCSRKQLKANNGYHPAHCRQGSPAPGDTPCAIRFALQDEHSCWHDQLLGWQQQTVHAELDDPVLLRKEGFFAYQLAVVVDDIDQNINHVVRGSDLQPMTAQQQQIYQALGARPPHWFHIPVLLNKSGQKLSKQTHAPALDDTRPSANLAAALAALGQQPPAGLSHEPVSQILDWAQAHWQRQHIPLTSRHHTHDI